MKKDKVIPELTWIVGEAEIVFSVADEAVARVPKDRFLTLLDGRVMTELFRLQCKTAYDQWDSAEWYARASRYLRKGLDLDQAARVMNAPGEHQTDITGETLRKLWANYLAYHKGDAIIETEIKRQGIEEKDYCKAVGQFQNDGGPQSSGTPIEEVFIEAWTAKNALARWGSPSYAAKELRLDPGDFKEWIDKNQKILDVLK